jgi:hypothetical protein
MAMDIQTEKLQIMKMVLEAKNPKMLRTIKNLLEKESDVDFWDSLPVGQKEEIEIGIAEVHDGEVVAYDQMMKKHRR